MSSLIECEDVWKIYRVGDVEVQALRGLSLTIEQGEFVAIMGSSGSGKSTLMNILGCLDQPTKGHYRLNGIEVGNLKPDQLAGIRNQQIGFVFQSFNLIPRTSALENAQLPLFYRGLSLKEQRAQAAAALGRVGLQGREHHYPTQLSGGQQQRVAIARALVTSPSLLLADEPTGNLDTQSSQEIMRILETLNRDEGITIILVTHEVDVAAYAAREIVIKDGQVLERPCDQGAANVQPSRGIDVGVCLAHDSHRAADLGAKSAACRSHDARDCHRRGGGHCDGEHRRGGQAGRASADRDDGHECHHHLSRGDFCERRTRKSGSAVTLTVSGRLGSEKRIPLLADTGWARRDVMQIVYGNRNWNGPINGISPSYLTIRDWSFTSGGPFTQTDLDSAARVALIGQTIVGNLFEPGEEPVGAVIRIKNVPFRVIGVLAPKGQSAQGSDQDDVIFIPFSTAERKVFGTSFIGSVGAMFGLDRSGRGFADGC